MKINWYGQTCFRIDTQVEKGKTVDILIDPFFDKELGIRGPKLDADILMVSQDRQEAVSGRYFLITGPGEYDVKGVYIQGIRGDTNSDKKERTTIYTMEAEGIKLCHLGILGQNELSSNQLEKINEVDILMLPVGGGKSLDVKKAVKVMSQIEPKIIIPMYYKVPKIKIKLDKIDSFLKELGIKSLEPLPKLNIKAKDLPKDEAKIIVLSA